MSNQRKGKPSILKGKTKEEVLGLEKAKEFRKKLSDRAKKKMLVGDNNPFYGKKHTNEVIEYLREINMGNNSLYNVNNAKPFRIEDKCFLFLKDASKELNINYLTIRHRLLSNNPKFNSYEYILDNELIEKLKSDYIINNNITR